MPNKITSSVYIPTGCWRRRLQEAIRIQRQPNLMNLDYGLTLSNIRMPALKFLLLLFWYYSALPSILALVFLILVTVTFCNIFHMLKVLRMGRELLV